MNPECIALQKCSATAVRLLAGGVVDLNSLGQELVCTDFITQAALNNILDPPGRSNNRIARELLQCVTAQVETDPEKFYKEILLILQKHPPLHTLLENIKQEHGMMTVFFNQCE